MTNQSEQTVPTTPPAVFHLPYTGDAIPANLAEITVKPTGEHETHDGIAFTALIQFEKRTLGTIENGGDGGGTWFHPHTAVDRKGWQRATEEMKAILEAEGEGYEFMAEEVLNDRLYENAATFRDLNRKRSIVARFGGDNDDIRIYKGTWDAEFQAAVPIIKEREGKTMERWVKGQGWEVV